MEKVLIANALELITEELNTFFGREEPEYRANPPAVLSDLVDQKGEPAFTPSDPARDNVIVTLINIEEETIGKAQLPYLKNPDNSINNVNPEIKVNLYVLFSAFSNMSDKTRYSNCLNMISYVILFFQYKHVFNRQNTPGLSEDIEKIIVELISPTFEQQNHIWGALGAKFMPSVLYKLRMLVFREIEEGVTGPVIDKIKTEKVHKR